ncbi:VOC family protein [Microlunatus parietis]|uniref:Putative enzyme related to lactoylglutathione lyase n=1 Tax=Microlunatus parietis TaxID=682979 RepID=A0A7Y9I936_9ACTN|nr:VOC family protein [Microlunatus parietis]NYE72594.1 putative enzyme related to lactoylglutathione lyase [Microlunatus parietis]
MQLGQIVIDSADPTQLAGFYAGVIGRPVADGGNPFMAQIHGDGAFPSLMFLAVPEPRTGKNRLHLDLVSDDFQAAAERAIGLGATKVGEFEEYGTAWVTLADPEGNVFDIGRPH